MAQTTKTTLYLDGSLRERLRLLSARLDRSMSDLLVEGAELVLARHAMATDADELRRRAGEARRALREGLFEADLVAAEVDPTVYGR